MEISKERSQKIHTIEVIADNLSTCDL
jgi:hypothetical protein